jgi:type I restriction-modification system DNA methylase subunit
VTTKDNSVSYDFSAIDADVLGTIYEQYLSHILGKTQKRAKLTENHNHRKEQGIYYTPTYVVEYIVRNTLGELLKSDESMSKKSEY